jgi:hypothetical protein
VREGREDPDHIILIRRSMSQEEEMQKRNFFPPSRTIHSSKPVYITSKGLA